MKKILIIALVAFAVIGCSKDQVEQIQTAINQNPIFYNGTMKFKANGVLYQKSGSGFGGTLGVAAIKFKDWNLSGSPSPYRNSYSIAGGPAPLLNFAIYADTLPVGDYSIKNLTPNTTSGFVSYNAPDGLEYGIKNIQFILRITKHSGNIIEGTFAGPVYNGTKLINISEGTFSSGILYQ